jgi:hypothetical protein
VAWRATVAAKASQKLFHWGAAGERADFCASGGAAVAAIPWFEVAGALMAGPVA